MLRKDGKVVDEVAPMLDLGGQTVRYHVHAFLYRGVTALHYRKAPGRPSKLSKTQCKELVALLKSGPEAENHYLERHERRWGRAKKDAAKRLHFRTEA
jgi:transposase